MSKLTEWLAEISPGSYVESVEFGELPADDASCDCEICGRDSEIVHIDERPSRFWSARAALVKVGGAPDDYEQPVHLGGRFMRLCCLCAGELEVEEQAA